jgi:hypothetical protein
MDALLGPRVYTLVRATGAAAIRLELSGGYRCKVWSVPVGIRERRALDPDEARGTLPAPRHREWTR